MRNGFPIQVSTDFDLHQFVECFPVIQGPGWVLVQFPHPVVSSDVKIVKPLPGECPSDPDETSPHPVPCLSEGQREKVGLCERT